MAAVCLLLGCGQAQETLPDGGDGGDGRYHPAPNGVHTSEAEACEALHDAVSDKRLELGCAKTLRPCPQFLWVQFGTQCMEYDEGSVQGCVEYYAAWSSCDQMDETQCVVTAYPGTEPAGCP